MEAAQLPWTARLQKFEDDPASAAIVKRVSLSGDAGKGAYAVVACVPLRVGDIAMLFIGETLSYDDLQIRGKIYEDAGDDIKYLYTFTCRADGAIDPTPNDIRAHLNKKLARGQPRIPLMDPLLEARSVAAYSNHSCSPNMYCIELQDRTNAMKAVLVAIQNIAPGTELTWDYRQQWAHNEGPRIVCRCGSAQCRGYVDYVPHRE